MAAHPRLAELRASDPIKVTDSHVGINGRIALRITRLVGSMWTAYIFALIALLGLPAALHPGGEGIVAWVAQTFLQLVLLSVIMVGQDVQAKASDRRAEATYKDAEAILSELALLHQGVNRLEATRVLELPHDRQDASSKARSPRGAQE